MTGLYLGKSSWFKIFLLIAVAVVSASFIWYTFQVIEQLKADTRSQVEKYVKLWQIVANSNTSGQELQFIFEEVIVKASFPIIVADANHEPVQWRNIDDIAPEDSSEISREQLRQLVASMRETNGEFPLYYGENVVNYFYYGDSKVIEQLTLMPFIEIGIVIAFMVVAVIGFQNIRRSEERHIWVGMAKETAHQLGTPISSLMGWVEVLDHSEQEEGGSHTNKGTSDIVTNMRVDINRLQRVANRFGQIGSLPDLQPTDINVLVDETVTYYSRRLPFEGKGTVITLTRGDLPPVKVNKELFTWALENLVKNAIQAVDAKAGRIDVRTSYDDSTSRVQIEIVDNGAGIPVAAARNIFKAGFTTKKRGWGLGLTLVKRIVEEYHGGKVLLRKSRPGETIFDIFLPLMKGQN